MGKRRAGYFLLFASLLALGAAARLVFTDDRGDAGGRQPPAISGPVRPASEIGEAPAPALLDWPLYGGNPEQSRGLSEDDLRRAGLPPRPCERQPTLRWMFSRPAGLSPPIVFGDAVAVGDGDGGLRLLDLATGAERRVVPLGEAAVAAPPFYCGGRLYVANAAGNVFRVDPETGAVEWTFSCGGKILGGLNGYRADNGRQRLLFGGYDSYFRILDAADGAELFAREVDGYVNGTAAVSSKTGRAFAADCGGTLTRIDAEKLAFDGQTHLGAHLPSTPAISAEAVYVSAHDGRLWRLPRDFTPAADADGGADADGNPGGGDDRDSAPLLASPAVAGPFVVSCREDGEIRVHDSGAHTLSAKKVFDENPADPLIVGDRLLAAFGSGSIRCLSLPELAEIWTIRTVHSFPSGPVFHGGGFLLADADGNLLAYAF